MSTAELSSLHTQSPRVRAWLAKIIIVMLAGSAGALPTTRAQNKYIQHNLVSDLPGQADRTDTNLVNPWGIVTSATSPFWLSDNHSGLSTLYNSTGGVLSLVVTVPPPSGAQGPAAPTGIVFNGDSKSFLVGTNAARFIFATEDGTISGWNSGTNAVLKVDNSGTGAVYKGLALASNSGSNYLYATDFHNGNVDVFDSSYQPVTMPGGFTDPNVPAGYAPFNIQNFGTNLYVTYAQQDADKHDDVAGPGHGVVNIFDTAGHLIKRFASNGPLNSPWGMAMAPGGFAQFSDTLLIGNFGDGKINSFDPATGALLGTLNDTNGAPIAISGLWGLRFGNGGQGGIPLTLYFTAGIPGTGSVEDHGLFGSISVGTLISLNVSPGPGNTVQLQWSGGTPPYLVQRKLQLSDTNWFNVTTTSNTTAILPKDGSAAFFRLSDQATNPVTLFTVSMSGPAEVPAVNSDATGFGIMSLQGTNLAYQIEFSGLSGPAIAAHIHGPANTTNAAGVLIPLQVPVATGGVLSGVVGVTSDQLAWLESGMTYVNIHTTINPGGEIRGQIAPSQFTATLSQR